MKPNRSFVATAARNRQRGAGALIVVLVLFFIMALVAAYSSRNLIFEQKTSANLYRSTQAFEAAEAGIEWALGMLNSGRITPACVPTSDAAATTFRQRYLDIASNGSITPRKALGNELRIKCVLSSGNWVCDCPSSSEPVLAAPVTTLPAPAFRLIFGPGEGPRPGVVRLRSQGCTRLDDSCLNDQETATGGDATSSVTVLLALKGALSTPPAAALTVRNDIDTTGAMRVVNTDQPTAGITTHIGRNDNGAAIVRQTLPGTHPDASKIENDGILRMRDTALMFSAYFGMTDELYEHQPAAIVLTCPADCGAVALATIAQRHPGRMLWLKGNVTLDASVDIGSPTSPVVLVVNGDLQSSAYARIYGLVYVNRSNWQTSGASLIQGAVIANDRVSGAGTPDIVFDPDVLRRLRTETGSFVRVPGAWKDF